MQVNTNNKKPDYDPLIRSLADYVMEYDDYTELSLETAQYCLMDTLGCAMLALSYPECTKLLGPWVEGQTTPNGARVPGTQYELDPIKAAFDTGMLVRWLDYNDTWLAAEWGHPSDNLGAILAVMDYRNRQGHAKFTVKDLLQAMIQAHEIQGVLALENSFNQVGLDHVVLVKIASTAVAMKLLGGTHQQVMDALTQALVDGQSLRTYRHAPNTGSRKSWAAGDATSRAVRLCLMVLKGETGYPSCLSVPRWGFEDVLFKKPIKLTQTLNYYVMENILFKISYPAEFHGQTAVECALNLHEKLGDKLDEIKSVHLVTQSSGFKIINKEGELHNPADRDHCLQYMVAVALLEGKLTAQSYADETAKKPEIDKLRAKMTCSEDDTFSRDYLDPTKRSIANRVEVTLEDGTKFEEEIHYPVGHKRRRDEGIPLLLAKFKDNLQSRYSQTVSDKLYQTCQSESLRDMPVDEFVQMWLD